MWRLYFFLLLPTSAFAEVSDKAPSLEQLVVSALIISAVAVPLILWRALPGIVATVVAIPLASLNYDLLLDRFVGPALIQEQGAAYAWVGYGSAAAVYVALVAAWAHRYRRRRHAV